MDLVRRATARVRGARHVRDGRPCQDEVGALSRSDLLAVAVADGHGTSIHGDVGARLAVAVALSALVRFVDDLGEGPRSLPEIQRYAADQLRRHVTREWAERVRARSEDLVAHGSTLIFALATPQFLLLGQIGDGDLLLVDRDGARAPLPPEPLAFADETTSLCQPEAWTALRVLALPRPQRGTLLLLATDGYSKSYEPEGFLQVGPDYLQLIEADGFASVAGVLPAFLSEITERGAGDDIAVALVFWTEPEAAMAEPVEPSDSATEVPPLDPPEATDEAIADPVPETEDPHEQA